MRRMYLNILKKDFKRKKTMNCIILLFVVLSTLFFASSMNNILSVIGGLDRYLDMAGMMSQVAMISEPDSGEPFADQLRNNDKVTDFSRMFAGTFAANAPAALTSIATWDVSSASTAAKPKKVKSLPSTSAKSPSPSVARAPRMNSRASSPFPPTWLITRLWRWSYCQMPLAELIQRSPS